jgi:hypothetical protein
MNIWVLEGACMQCKAWVMFDTASSVAVAVVRMQLLVTDIMVMTRARLFFS